MNAAESLTLKIREHIPLSRSMEFCIDVLDLEGIKVSAPLSPNINIHGTGFAGSIYSLAILTGWALATHVMQEMQIEAELVVGKAEIRYRAPVIGDLECSSHCEQAARDDFSQGVLHQGKGRLDLKIDVNNGAAELVAGFTAVARDNQA